MCNILGMLICGVLRTVVRFASELAEVCAVSRLSRTLVGGNGTTVEELAWGRRRRHSEKDLS
jgi:hypothetical protein